MEPCLIIFDIDETLYMNHKSRIPGSTLDAIKKLKAAGHTLAIATGRAPFELIEEAKHLPLDFFILANGQLIVQNDEVIYENAIDQATITALIAEAEALNVHIGFNFEAHSTVTGMTDAMRESFAKYYTHMPKVSKEMQKHSSIYQIWYFSEDLTNIAEKFKDQLRFIPWLTNGADVIPAGASKAVGLTKALEILGNSVPKKIVFFGDGTNDIELMEMADIGVAMGNAVEPLKAIADFVTKNIEDDGIYYACEQLGLFEVNKVNVRIVQLKAKIATEPYMLDYYFQLKALYSGYTRESKKAIQILEKALVHFPDNIKLLIELAATYEFELEDYEKAKIYYELVLKLDPSHELAINALEVLTNKNIHPDD